MKVNIDGQSAYTGMKVNIEGRAEYTSTKNAISVKFDANPGKGGELTKLDSLGNSDILMLSMPKSESVYKRTEFINDDSIGEGCAYCYTYMEKTLTFEDEKYGTCSLTFSSTSSHFVINMDDFSRTFGKSRSDMNSISHAVEETWEYTERSFEQATLSGSLSELISKDGETVGTNIVFAAQSSAYKRTTASVTKGTVAYKDGSMGWYRENALSNREIYNNCIAYMAEAFRDDSPIPVMGEKEFNELFAKPAGNEKKPSDNADKADSASNAIAAKPKSPLEKREELLYSLNKFMERNLAAVRKKDPHSAGLKAFENTYLKLGTYKYSEITSLVQKMFAAGTKK